MSARNTSGVCKCKRNGKAVLVIDFRYRSTDGKQHRYRRDAAVQTMAAALTEARHRMERAALTGCPYEDAPTTAPTFASFVDDTFIPTVLVSGRYRPATRETYVKRVRPLIEHYGRARLDRICESDHVAFEAAQAKCRASSREPLILLRTVLRSAHELGVVPNLPALPRIHRPSGKIPSCPSDTEHAILLGGAQGWLRQFVALAAYAGLRCGEARALEVGDVDWSQGCIHVRRAYSAEEILTPKDDADRTIPIAERLHPILRDACRGKLPRARVLLTQAGRPLGRRAIDHQFARLVQRTGLPPYTPHQLRHYFLTSLARHGAGIEAIRLLAGHSAMSTTARYLHASRADLRAAISTLSGQPQGNTV